MKHAASLAALIIFASFVTVSVADETVTLTGDSGGRTVSITPTANVVTITPTARIVKVSNAGSAVVYAAARVTGAQFAAMVTGTNAIPIAASGSFEFIGGSPIGTIVLKSATAATNSVTLSIQR